MIYEFQATQDLHGYEKPWAGGTNVNKFNSDAIPDSTSSNGGITNLGNGEIYVHFDTAGSSAFSTGKKFSEICDVTEDDIGDTFYFNAVSNGNKYIYLGPPASRTLNFGSGIQLSSDILESIVFLYAANSAPSSATISNILFAKSGSAIPFTPYANVCMPEGFNIWDPSTQEYIQVYAGYVNSNTRELYLRPVYDEYAGEELVGPWMSSLDPYEEDTTPTEGAFVIDFGGELTSFEITPFMLQTLLDSLGIRQHFTDGAGLLNKLMDQAQGRVRSEEELLHLSRPLNVIAIGDQLPAGLTFKPISKDVLPGLPGKFIR